MVALLVDQDDYFYGENLAARTGVPKKSTTGYLKATGQVSAEQAQTVPQRNSENSVLLLDSEVGDYRNDVQAQIYHFPIPASQGNHPQLTSASVSKNKSLDKHSVAHKRLMAQRTTHLAPGSLRKAAAAIGCAVAVGIGFHLLSAVSGASASVNDRNVAATVATVEPGQTLNSIAAQLAPDLPSASVVDVIMKLNHLSSGAITPGEKLVLPHFE